MPAFLALFLCVVFAVSQHHMVMFHAPQWSPDGKWITLSTNINGPDEVWDISADGKVKRKLAGEQPHTSPPPREIGGLSVVEENTGAGQVIVATRQGAPPQRISTVTWAEQPSVSPDGRQVVFEQRQNAHDILSSDIAIWNAQDQKVRVLTRGTDPSWSRDGRRVLFKTADQANLLWIATIDVASGRVQRLAPGVHPAYSPDGQFVAFMGSADGKSIAFATDTPDRSDVYVIRADGTDRRCITCDWK